MFQQSFGATFADLEPGDAYDFDVHGLPPVTRQRSATWQ
jgi:hypothetical protein